MSPGMTRRKRGLAASYQLCHYITRFVIANVVLSPLGDLKPKLQLQRYPLACNTAV
jgi:hypothetical protein